MQHFAGIFQLIEHLDIYGPMVVADFGAGSGQLALPIARKLAPEGKLYAIDIQEGPLAVLRKSARDAHLHHVETIRANLEQRGGSKLKDAIADWVITANILFQAPDQAIILREAFRILKNHGTLLIVEWHPDANHPVGPRQHIRIPKPKLFALLRECGFRVEREFTLGEHHHGILAKKS